MGSSKSSAEPTRQSINAGMVIVGLVLLATAVDQTAGLQLLWFALPVVVMVVGGAKVSQQWRQFRHWRAQQVVISEQRLAMRAGHLEQAAQERALAIIESKGHGLDFQARAIRHAQIGIWVVHIATQQITFEGIHIGSR